MAQTIPCTDLLSLVELSGSSFDSITGETKNEFGGLNSTKILPKAEYCTIWEDPEKRTYRCTWTFSYAATEAKDSFRLLGDEVKTCLGDRAEILSDQPVNHPDTYESSIFQLPQAVVNVSLKNKIELKATLISVSISGLLKARSN